MLGLLAWGVPLLAIAIAPLPFVAVAALVVAGAGRSLMDVAGRILLQRATPDEVLTRIFGVLEGSFLGAFGLGSIAVAWVIATQGPQVALLVAGLWLPVVAAIAWRSLRRIDLASTVPLERLALLRAIPMLAPLAPATLERLARALVPVNAAAGGTIVRQGDAGDRYYVIAAGTVEIASTAWRSAAKARARRSERSPCCGTSRGRPRSRRSRTSTSWCWSGPTSWRP